MDDGTLDYYDRNASRLAVRYEGADMSAYQSILSEVFKYKKDLLELGCGSGRDASFMLSRGFDVVGVDGSLDLIVEAQKFHPELSDRLYGMRIPEEYDFPGDSFDGIYSVAMLMHLEKPEIHETIRRSYNFLKEGGLFFFSVPSKRNDLVDGERDKNSRLFNVMLYEEWREICEAEGFVEERHYFTGDNLGRNNVEWLNLIVKKPDGN